MIQVCRDFRIHCAASLGVLLRAWVWVRFKVLAQPPRFARTHLDVEVFCLVFAGCLHSATCD